MEKFIKRDIFEKVAKHLEKKEISVIIGPRQVGKTVLLKQLKEYLILEKKIDPSLIYYFNLDIYSDRDVFKSQTDFIEFIKQRSKKNKIYVFVDEAQKVENAGVFFKGVYDSDLNAKMVLTGSSTLEIRSKIYESLTGRKRVFYLLPFSFLEILKAKDEILFNVLDNGQKLIKRDKEKLIALYKDYCLWGGYPQVVLADSLSEKKEYLQEIFSSYLEKDIIGFLKVKNEDNFIKLVKVLASQIGSLTDVAELSNAVNTDRYTIDRYLEILEKTFVIKKITPFFANSKKEIVKAPKIYFLDIGLRNFSLKLLDNNFDDLSDRGSAFENSIFKELFLRELQGDFNVKFWRNKQGSEIDFILEKGKKLIPVEVKLDLKNNNSPRTLVSFLKKYSVDKAFVFNLGYNGERIFSNKIIKFIYPFKNYEL